MKNSHSVETFESYFNGSTDWTNFKLSFAASVNDWVLSLVIDIYYQLLSFLASDSYPALTIQFYP